MRHRITLTDDDSRFDCDASQAVLLAMRDAGRACLPVGCRSGGCGVCRVQVLSGAFETGLMSAAQISPADRAQGIVLACQLFPRGDLRLRRVVREPKAGANAVVSSLNWYGSCTMLPGSKR